MCESPLFLFFLVALGFFFFCRWCCYIKLQSLVVNDDNDEERHKQQRNRKQTTEYDRVLPAISRQKEEVVKSHYLTINTHTQRQAKEDELTHVM